MNLASPLDNFTALLGGAYTAGSGSLTLATGYGSILASKLSALGLPPVSATAPLRITVVTAVSYQTAAEVQAIFRCTGRTGDTLTGVAAVDGSTDRGFSIGDVAECRPTAGAFRDVQLAATTPFVGSGISHAPGIVPDPGSSAGTTHYLREDGTWAVPPTGGGGGGGAVSSVAGRTGDVTLAIADTAGLQAAIDLKAPLASPALTGTPTTPTAAGGTNTTQVASTAFVRGEVSAMVASAPAALDTLNELSAALGNDANFAATTATALGLKAADSAVVHNTGAETIAGAKTFSTPPILGALTGLLKGAAGTISRADAGVDYGLGSSGANPIYASGLIAAYRAESLGSLADGATVTNWADDSGNGRTLTTGQGAAIYVAQASESGRPGVRFDGATNLVNAALTFNLNAVTIIAVMAPETLGATAVPIGFNASPAMGLVLNSGAVTFNTGSGTAGLAAFVSQSGIHSPGDAVMVAVSDGVNWRLGCNSQEYSLATPIASSASVTGITVGSYPANSFYMTAVYKEIYIFNRAVPAAELLTFARFLHAKNNVRLKLDTRKPIILADGNSIMRGVKATTQPREPMEIAMDLLGRGNFDYRNVSWSGAKNSQVTARIAGTTALQVQGKQRLKIVLPWEGSNETTQSAIASMYTTWVAQPGTSVFAMTTLARSSATITTTNNAYVRANWRTWGCVGLIDCAMDYRLGQQSSNTNTAYFDGDATHPNDTGNAVIGPIIYNNILAFLNQNGGGPDPQFPGLTLDATPVVIKSWFPTAGDGVYLLMVEAAANRVDSGTEDMYVTPATWKMRIASGVLSVVTSPTITPVYNTLSTATISVSQSSLGNGGFDIKATGEASKVLAWRFRVRLVATV